MVGRTPRPQPKGNKMRIELPNKHPIGTHAKTGEICPESGVWQTLSNPSTTAPIAKGDRLPPYRGEAVTWFLLAHA